MNRRFFPMILLISILLSGCILKMPTSEPPVTSSQKMMIYDISGTYEAFTKAYFSIDIIADSQKEIRLLDYGTITPDKDLIADANFDGTNINYTPITDQGTGTAWITLMVDGNEQTVYVKMYDLSRKLVSLDFDDGPSEFTDDILDILRSAGASATFYVTGKAYQDVREVYVGAELYPETLKRAVKGGHQIGNHTYSHPWLDMDYENGPPDQDKDWLDYRRSEIMEEIERLDDLVFDLAGFVPDYFALPYSREIDLAGLEKTVTDRAVNCYDTYDWIDATTADEIAQTILSTPDDATILMHDVYETTAEGLRKALASSEAEKYQFMTKYELDIIRQQVKK